MHYAALALEYEKLSKVGKLTFLSQVLHELTVRARENYRGIEYSETMPMFERMMGYNELYHKIACQIGGLITASGSYPDRDFIDILFETAESYNLKKSLEFSLNRSLALLEKTG